MSADEREPSESPQFLEMLLTTEDVPGLREAIQEGYRARTSLVVYRGVGMDHRPAHHVLERLDAGEEEIRIAYEPWQVVCHERPEER